MLPGYLRKNGVPYSERAVLTEYVNLVAGQQSDSYIAVTAMVDDPVYLIRAFRPYLSVQRRSLMLLDLDPDALLEQVDHTAVGCFG